MHFNKIKIWPIHDIQVYVQTISNIFHYIPQLFLLTPKIKWAITWKSSIRQPCIFLPLQVLDRSIKRTWKGRLLLLLLHHVERQQELLISGQQLVFNSKSIKHTYHKAQYANTWKKYTFSLLKDISWAINGQDCYTSFISTTTAFRIKIKHLYTDKK